MASFSTIVLLSCIFSASATLDNIQWQPVFQVQSGSGFNVFKLWTGDGTLDEGDTFKSDLVNSWAGINKVKFTLSSDGVEEVNLVFDAKNSDRMSWFSPHRLLSSKPYTDIRSEYREFFSLTGVHVKGGHSRRFYLSRIEDGCEESKGWMMVVDTDSVSSCMVENYPRPIFLYSQWKGYANTKHFSTAGLLTISVEADDPAQWDMVFRSTTGVEFNIFNLWTSNVTMNVDDEDIRTTQPFVSGVYKSNRVNTWSQVNKVKLAVYEKGKEMAYFTFDASDSDRMSWFTRDRLISSSYVDLYDSDTKYFSIPGHAINRGIQRRFYVIRNYESFCVDYGWFLVADRNSGRGCDWDVQGPNPAFLYSRGRTVSKADRFARADVFAIFFNKAEPEAPPSPAYDTFESHWTRMRTGCMCYFDNSRSDCACCIEGGCQCTDEHPKQCVQCGYNERCGLMESVPGAWTGNATCACHNDPDVMTCACCHNNGCQCARDNRQCTQCGREDQC